MRNVTRTLLLLCCAVCAFAREESTRDFRKTVALSGGRNLRIEHSLGNVTIRTHSKNEVAIQATIRCSADTAELARTCAEEIKVTVQETGAGVSVRTEYPERRNQHNLSYGVRYGIAMPDTTPPEIRNRCGAVGVSRRHAPAVANNGNGTLKCTRGGA